MLLLLVVMIVIACIGAARRRMRRVSPQTISGADSQAEHNDPDYIPGYTVGSGNSEDESDATLT